MSYSYLFIACLCWIFHCSFGLVKVREPQFFSKQNKSFFFPKYRPEIFYDNKVLVEDVEVDVFLFKDELQKLFYLLEGSFRPFTITVTPCSSSSAVEWRVSHQPLPSSATHYREDPYYNHIYRPQSVVSTVPSAAYTGTERRSYTNALAPPGLYVLEIESMATTQAKVVITTRSCTDYSYHPTLPTIKNVQIVKAKRNRVLISWKPSSFRKPVEYCVTSNTAGNYHSFCSATSDLLSSHPVSPPASAGFGFHWERSTRKTILSNFVSDVPKNNASLICVGRKTWHMFRGLERGKTYYFDVFAVDTENNASTAYIGVKATIKSHRYSLIKEDTLMTFPLDENNGYAVSVKYATARNTSALHIFAQSCTGPGPVIFTITKNYPGGKPEEILSERIMDVRTLEVPHEKDVQNNSITYVLNFKPTTKVSRKVRLWVSSRSHSYPYPIMPSDKNVKVFDTLITCDSITIGWKASPNEKVKYCIYRSPASDDVVRKTLTEPRNSCQTTDNVSESRITVLCRRYHRFSKRRFNNVIMQRVRGLEPGTTYLFEVQVTKVKGKVLPYERVWASTRRTCARARSKR